MKHPKNKFLRIRADQIDHLKFRRLVEFFGTQALLAHKLGVSRALVSQWKHGFANIPVKHLKAIEKLSVGKFKTHFLMKKGKEI